MSYSVLLVDDETPALRFMQAIIEKYLPQFTVVEKATAGVHALDCLRRRPVDLMITDICMPGMDGIALARQARAMRPDMHMVIVSGYAEFEYARGALNVAADEYLLKPLSVPNMTKALEAVAQKLAAEYAARRSEVICALACCRSPAAPVALLSQPHCFAVIRWGNLRAGHPLRLFTTGVVACPGFPFTVLSGTDENEQIVVSDQPFADFQAAFLPFARAKAMPFSAALNRVPMPLSALGAFIEQAMDRIEKFLVIGRRQIFYLEDSEPALAPVGNPAAFLRRIEHFTAIGNMKMVKDTLFTMAAEWEKQQCTQRQVSAVVYPLLQQVILSTPGLINRQEQIFRETGEMIQYASSYGSLAAGLYAILYDDHDVHDRNLSPKELCESILAYIRQNYAKPLSVQNVCSEIGISQTYLSRLLRKYADTSFSVCLTRCRMEAAMAMIRQHPDIMLRDVAACVGYDDASYFSRVFHQTTGLTPSQFADSLGQGSY